MKDVRISIWDYRENRMYRFYGMDSLTLVNSLDSEYFEKLLYIGLEDRDGTSIYEGDIIEIDADGEISRHVVVWGNRDTRVYPAFCLSPQFDCDANCISFLYENYGEGSVKVLGNKYENPDLI